MIRHGRRILSVLVAAAAVTTVATTSAEARDGSSAMRAARAAAHAADHDTDWGDGHGHAGVSARASARTTTVNPAAGPDFELPFRCGQSWRGSSRAGHSPSYYSLDFNAASDLGQPVLASAPGVVTTARTLSGSYGRYVVIDHGGGFTTLYGHLNGIVATVGQHLDQGELVGYLGSSGNSTGPHLHFEERLNGAYFAPYFHRATFRINSTTSSLNCTDRPVVADWDGNGTTDLGVFRTTSSSSVFYLRRQDASVVPVAWGSTGDVPVVGDFDGDRIAQLGVRRLTSPTWLLRSQDGALATVNGVGTTSDAPLTGDWDGNGRDNLGFYRWSTSTFYLRSEQGVYTAVRYGDPGDVPIVGDWDGDGRTDLGVFRPSTTRWFPRVSSSPPAGFPWAVSTDVPIVGDWNGDGRSEIGVWRPSTSRFYLRTSLDPANGAAPSYAFGYGR